MPLPPPVRGARAAFVFLTRLPLGGYPYRDEDYAWAPAHGPLVGLVVGGIGGVVFALAFGAGPLPAALLALGATMLATGAFHEDGLADTADALGGAIFDRGRLLEILKDSRIGTYGAAALATSILLRAALVASVASATALHEDPRLSGAAALVVSHVLARVAPVWLMASMPYVTDEAHARSRPVVRAGLPQAVVATGAGALAVAAAVVLLPAAAPRFPVAYALLLPVALLCAWRFRRRAGGITGDFLGATEQVAECAVLLALAL